MSRDVPFDVPSARALSPERAVVLLNGVLSQLGRCDRPVTEQLIRMCRGVCRGGGGSLSLHLLLTLAWPDKAVPKAGERFLRYQRRFNAHLKSRALPVRLACSGGREAMAHRKVWLEMVRVSHGRLSQEPGLIQHRVEGQGSDVHPYRQPACDVSQPVTTYLPTSPWRAVLRRFADRHGGARWHALSQDARCFFSNLQVKFEPITQLLPVADEGLPIIGLEFLALGPTGESHEIIMQRADQVGLARGFVAVLLALAQSQAADMLRADTPSRDVAGMPPLLFTFNIGPEMLDEPCFEAVLIQLNKPGVLFELDERHTNAKRLVRLQAAHALRYVLDDSNAWHDKKAARTLARHVEWTKLDFKAYQRARGKCVGDVEPTRVYKRLKKFKLSGKPLVVEGVETREDVLLLQSGYQKHNHPVPIYGQGFVVEVDAPWNRWLVPLEELAPGLRGWVWASPYLARVTRMVHDHVGPDDTFKRRMVGAFYCFELRGRHKKSQTLWVSPDRPGRQGDAPPGRLFQKTDWLVAPPGGGEIFAAWLVVISEAQLPALLTVWREGVALGEKVLREAACAQHYPFDWYQEYGVASPLSADHPDPDGAEGIQALMGWLADARAPFCALLGVQGVGKTFLCRVFVRAVMAANRHEPTPLPVPLYLNLANVPGLHDGKQITLNRLLEPLSRMVGHPATSVAVLLAAVRTGHVALVLDGLDEMAVAMTVEEVDHVMAQLQGVVPTGGRGKVLISGHARLFRDEPVGGVPRTKRVYDGWRLAWPAEALRAVPVPPFDRGRIHRYLAQRFPCQGGYQATLGWAVDQLLALASRPLALSLMADVLPALEARVRAGACVAAAQLYETVVEKWLTRDRRGPLSQKRHKFVFMEVLAFRLWERRVSSLHYTHLWMRFMCVMGEPVPGGACVKDEKWIDPELRTTVFLVRDHGGHYRFSHASFQAYFLAHHVWTRLRVAGRDVLDMPPLTVGVLRFLWELAVADQPAGDRVGALLCDAHHTDQRPLVRENSGRIWRFWQRERAQWGGDGAGHSDHVEVYYSCAR